MTKSLQNASIAWPLLIAAAALIAAATLLGSSGRAGALTNCTISDAEVSLNTEEQAFLTLINNYRAQNGRSALTAVTSLNRSAAWHANDMIAKGYFSHDEPGGRTWSTRITNCGYPTGGFRGENIAAGFSSASSVFTAWKNSSGHNANMLSANFTKIGIGKVGSYWNTDFGSVADGTGSAGVVSTATKTPTRTATTSGAAATATRTPTRTATPVKTATPSAQAWTATASMSPTTLGPGVKATLTTRVKPPTSTTGMVVVEAFDPSGKLVLKKSWDGRTLSSSSYTSFGIVFTTPTSWVAGTYKLKVSIYGTGGSPLKYSNTNAGSFQLRK